MSVTFSLVMVSLQLVDQSGSSQLMMPLWHVMLLNTGGYILLNNGCIRINTICK